MEGSIRPNKLQLIEKKEKVLSLFERDLIHCTSQVDVIMQFKKRRRLGSGTNAKC